MIKRFLISLIVGSAVGVMSGWIRDNAWIGLIVGFVAAGLTFGQFLKKVIDSFKGSLELVETWYKVKKLRQEDQERNNLLYIPKTTEEILKFGTVWSKERKWDPSQYTRTSEKIGPP